MSLADKIEAPSIPLRFYRWRATIERDARVRELTDDEIASLIAALRAKGDGNV